MPRNEGEYTTNTMLNMQCREREEGDVQEKMAIREVMKEYKMTEDMAENRSLWHMRTKPGPLLLGRDLEMRSDFSRSVGPSECILCSKDVIKVNRYPTHQSNRLSHSPAVSDIK